MIRRVLRYKKADFFLLSSFIVTSLCLILLIVICSENKRYERDLETYAYKHSIQIIFEQKEDLTVLPISDLLSEMEGVIMICDWTAYSKTVRKSLCINVVLSCTEELKIPFRETNLDEFAKNPDAIVLGDVTKRFLDLEGNVLELGGRVFTCIGTSGSRYSTYGYDQSYIWIDATEKEFWESINRAKTITVLFQSDIISENKFTQEIVKRMETNDYGWTIQGVSHYYADNPNKDVEAQKTAYVLLFSFSFLNCWVAIRYWLLVREKEIYVRMVNGCTEWKVIRILYYQAVKLSLIAVVCGAGIVTFIPTTLSANRILDIVGIRGILMVTGITLTIPFLLIIGNVWVAFRKKKIKWEI